MYTWVGIDCARCLERVRRFVFDPRNYKAIRCGTVVSGIRHGEGRLRESSGLLNTVLWKAEDEDRTIMEQLELPSTPNNCLVFERDDLWRVNALH